MKNLAWVQLLLDNHFQCLLLNHIFRNYKINPSHLSNKNVEELNCRIDYSTDAKRILK